MMKKTVFLFLLIGILLLSFSAVAEIQAYDGTGETDQAAQLDVIMGYQIYYNTEWTTIKFTLGWDQCFATVRRIQTMVYSPSTHQWTVAKNGLGDYLVERCDASLNIQITNYSNVSLLLKDDFAPEEEPAIEGLITTMTGTNVANITVASAAPDPTAADFTNQKAEPVTETIQKVFETNLTGDAKVWDGSTDHDGSYSLGTYTLIIEPQLPALDN